ncbi:hypothetical protein ACFUNF_09535 [Streptomyces sp. NPDC057291]|uniref:hypothetical protein n=1 Tax=Streptomyces sp. NPDC057291 TaxID=3346087 RepID=UPI00363A9FCE
MAVRRVGGEDVVSGAVDHRGVRVERVDDGTADNGATDFGGATEERSGRLFAPVLAAQFMPQLDTFIVNVAAPTIRTELGASGTELQLVVAGYTISYDVLLIIGTGLGGPPGHDGHILPGSRSSPPPRSPADWLWTPGS